MRLGAINEEQLIVSHAKNNICGLSHRMSKVFPLIITHLPFQYEIATDTVLEFLETICGS